MSKAQSVNLLAVKFIQFPAPTSLSTLSLVIENLNAKRVEEFSQMLYIPFCLFHLSYYSLNADRPTVVKQLIF
jgi:hypothetical protein